MDDREFVDKLYQTWAKTTGAGERYWQPVKYQDQTKRFKVYAVNIDGQQLLAGSEMAEVDADFVCSVHGALPELVNVVLSALDEADRADLDRDSRECRIAELEAEVADLREVVERLSYTPPWTSNVRDS